MIEIDGSGGGGQLLRTALTLALCTGSGFAMRQIRARRSRPGLMRQHLTAVEAAAAIGGARVEGAELGSTRLRFEPGAVAAGEYAFATGSAGSTTLVLQTVLPALWGAPGPSRLRFEGGTHNPMAPSVDFLRESFLPQLARMGVAATLELERPGFYPAGGGLLHATIEPAGTLRRLGLHARGERLGVHAVATVSALAPSIARRELQVLATRLGLQEGDLHLQEVEAPRGPGNVVQVYVRHAAHTEVFSGHGERGVSAEAVAGRVADEVQAYLASDAFAGEHLGDQLLLPMALAGGGEFTTIAVGEHLSTNARLIESFLPVRIAWEAAGEACWRVRVAGAAAG